MTLKSRAAEWMLPKKKVQKESDDALWKMLKEKVDLGLELRRPYEQKWLINLAFLAGRQYTFFNSTAHLLQQVKPVVGRIRVVDNKLLPRWKRLVADWIKTEPQMSVVPQTMEQEDIEAARVGDKVIKGFWQSNRMKMKQRLLAGWVYATGNGFLDDRWNKKLGPVVTGADGTISYAGDVDCGVWSPFEILVPFSQMGSTDLHGFPWMIKMKWRELDYLRGNYKKGGMVPAEDSIDATTDFGILFGGVKAATQKVEGAMLYELYVQPCVEFSKGLFLVGSNGIVLEKEDYPFRTYNLEHFKDIDIPGIFHGKAVMEDAIPLQKSWNRTRSSIEEFNRMMAKGKWLIPRGAKMEVDPDDTHGQKLMYNAKLGQKPELLSLKGLPPSLNETLAVISASLDDLFHQHEISRGTNKSDIRSGEMVSLLREQDAHGAIPSHAIFEESLERVMSRVLKRVQKGYSEERMINVVGRDDDIEVFSFKGADLRNNTDVKVKKQSSLPDSRIAREARVMEKFERGIYGDPADPEVRRHVMSMIDDAPVSIFFSQDKQDESLAQWENRVLMQMREVVVNSYDNHSIHMKEHDKQRKKLDFQKLKIQNPTMFMQLSVMIEQHCQGHQQFLAEQEQRMIQREMMLKGKEA